jgi:hypothetical protein
MNISIETIQAIIEKHKSNLDDHTEEYGEPGYNDNPKECILFANWNPVPRRIRDWLEHHGYALEWSDEWTVNWEGDRKAYRTSPSSYGWKSSIVYLDDGQMIAKGEVEDGTCLDDYIKYLVDHPTRCDQFDVDWSENGFERMVPEGQYETGSHACQNDDPRKLFAEWKARKPDHEFLFTLDEQSQFYITYSIWGRKKEGE